MNVPFSRFGDGPGEPGGQYDVRPLVASGRRDRSVWWFAGAAMLAGLLLFAALEARRRGAEQAELRSAPGALQVADPIPDLVMPQSPYAPVDPRSETAWLEPANVPRAPASSAPLASRQRPATIGTSAPIPSPRYDYQAVPPPPMIVDDGPLPMSPEDYRAAVPAAAGKAADGANRILAGRMAHPATTVVQGTLINAVLETAFDSTQPGQARAVVTRDVYGFDGSRLLIPRGTRLYGVYDGKAEQGQKRAHIRWARLLRPDGVSVALDSPAADPLGRAGVPAKVNNHFIQRLGNALLGTTAGIGSALVNRGVATSPVIIAVPGGTQAAMAPMAQGNMQITPTLTVRQGTRVTVFVQHDLDFTSVESAP